MAGETGASPAARSSSASAITEAASSSSGTADSERSASSSSNGDACCSDSASSTGVDAAIVEANAGSSDMSASSAGAFVATGSTTSVAIGAAVSSTGDAEASSETSEPTDNLARLVGGDAVPWISASLCSSFHFVSESSAKASNEGSGTAEISAGSCDASTVTRTWLPSSDDNLTRVVSGEAISSAADSEAVVCSSSPNASAFEANEVRFEQGDAANSATACSSLACCSFNNVQGLAGEAIDSSEKETGWSVSASASPVNGLVSSAGDSHAPAPPETWEPTDTRPVTDGVGSAGMDSSSCAEADSDTVEGEQGLAPAIASTATSSSEETSEQDPLEDTDNRTCTEDEGPPAATSASAAAFSDGSTTEWVIVSSIVEAELAVSTVHALAATSCSSSSSSCDDCENQGKAFTGSQLGLRSSPRLVVRDKLVQHGTQRRLKLLLDAVREDDPLEVLELVLHGGSLHALEPILKRLPLQVESLHLHPARSPHPGRLDVREGQAGLVQL
mmetsp:Transcript_94531/g.267039  ORF Transcript_94531/g.267039 Transcript_94531/m.267039 type:complete len:504 (+) Transcript_94531:960-2471(+)